MSRPKAPVLDLTHRGDRTFLHLLLNVLIVSVMNFTVWFAITFWVFIETRSVLATGMVAGIFLVCTAACGIWFGSLVDHHRKKVSMQGSVIASLAFYVLAFGVYLVVPDEAFTRASSVWLWVFIVLAMFGVIAGNVRMIAMMTLVAYYITWSKKQDKPVRPAAPKADAAQPAGIVAPASSVAAAGMNTAAGSPAAAQSVPSAGGGSN